MSTIIWKTTFSASIYSFEQRFQDYGTVHACLFHNSLLSFYLNIGPSRKASMAPGSRLVIEEPLMTADRELAFYLDS